MEGQLSEQSLRHGSGVANVGKCEKSNILRRNILIWLINLASGKVSFLQPTMSKHFVFSTDCSFCEKMHLLGDCNCDDVNWCREVQCNVPAKCDETCKNYVIHLLNN